MIKSSTVLTEERAQKIQAQGALLEARKQAGADFTDEQRASFNALQSDINKLDDQIAQRKTEEAAEQRAASLAAPKPADTSVNRGPSAQEAKDLRSYSLLKVVRSRTSQTPLTGIEAEVHQQAEAEAREAGVGIDGIGIPSSLATTIFAPELRAMNVTTPGDGGYLVPEEPQHLITALREAMAVGRAGAVTLGGLVGDLPLNSLAGVTVAWASETGNAGETNPAATQYVMKPKRITAYSTLTNMFLKQTSPDVERALRNDYLGAIMEAIDAAAIKGGGSNQPVGILATNGIGSVLGGTDGALPTLAHMLELEEQVSIAKALQGSLAYVTNHKVRRVLKGTNTATNSGIMVWQGNDVNGYAAYSANSVPSNLTKGAATEVCSAIIFGNFNDLLIGQWGGFDILVDPYTQGIGGQTRLIAAMHVDVGVKRAASFAAMLDALTVAPGGGE